MIANGASKSDWAIERYLMYLCGNTDELELLGGKKTSARQAQAYAERCINFACRYLLGYKTLADFEKMNEITWKQLGFDILAKHIPAPDDCLPNDYAYRLAVICGVSDPLQRKDFHLLKYKNMHDMHLISKYNPSLFRAQNNGKCENLFILMNRFIHEHFSLSSSRLHNAEKLYAAFDDSAAMNKRLHEASLYTPYRAANYKLPIDALHASLKYYNLEDEMLYDVYCFKHAYDAARKDMARARRKAEKEQKKEP